MITNAARPFGWAVLFWGCGMAKIDRSVFTEIGGLSVIAAIAEGIPFVAAKAMNDLAWQARNQIRDHLADAFILRNRRAQQGIRVKNANYRNGSPAEVFTLDDWMARHEEGGVRQSIAGHRMAIPIEKSDGNHNGIRSNVRVILRSGSRPRALRSKNHEVGTFGGLGKFKNKKTDFIFRRRKAKEGERIELLYALVDQVKISPRLDMVKISTDVVRRGASAALESALDYHLKNPKKAKR